MRSLNVTVFCICLLALAPGWTKAEESDLISEPWRWSSEHSQTSPPPATSNIYQASLTHTYNAVPPPQGSVRRLIPDSNGPRTEGLLATTTWLKGAFASETEMAANQGTDFERSHGAFGSGGNDPRTRMMRLGLKASSKSLQYGMTYRRAGQDFYNGADQATREVWGEWKQGVTTLRSTIGKRWNNVEDDPNRSRLENNYGQVGLTWQRPIWPRVALTYSRDIQSSAGGPLDLPVQRMNHQTLQASLGYTSSVWDAALSSGYIFGTDLLKNGAESQVNTQTVTASFRPFNTVTLTPTVGYRAEQQEWSGVHIDSPSASLVLHYRQSQELLLSAQGNYSVSRSNDKLIDLENIGGKGILTWNLQQSPTWSSLLSFETGYTRQINRLTSSIDSQDLSGIMRFVLAPL